MTDTCCWIRFGSDRSLIKRIEAGTYTGYRKKYGYFPWDFPLRPRSSLWTVTLLAWCREQKIEHNWVNQLTISARVKQHQIMAFIEHVYGNDPGYFDPKRMFAPDGEAFFVHRLIDLKAFVMQEMQSRLWYELVADEY